MSVGTPHILISSRYWAGGRGPRSCLGWALLDGPLVSGRCQHGLCTCPENLGGRGRCITTRHLSLYSQNRVFMELFPVGRLQ